MVSLTFIMTNWFSRCLQSVFGQVFIQIWVQHGSVPNSNSIRKTKRTVHGTILAAEWHVDCSHDSFSLHEIVHKSARSETNVSSCVFFWSTKCPTVINGPSLDDFTWMSSMCYARWKSPHHSRSVKAHLGYYQSGSMNLPAMRTNKNISNE